MLFGSQLSANSLHAYFEGWSYFAKSIGLRISYSSNPEKSNTWIFMKNAILHLICPIFQSAFLYSNLYLGFIATILLVEK